VTGQGYNPYFATGPLVPLASDPTGATLVSPLGVPQQSVVQQKVSRGDRLDVSKVKRGEIGFPFYYYIIRLGYYYYIKSILLGKVMEEKKVACIIILASDMINDDVKMLCMSVSLLSSVALFMLGKVH
jgi:hypothetical protein